MDSSSEYLPVGEERRNFGLATSGGYLYVAGGETAAGAYLNDVYVAPLNSDGTVGAWSAGTAFTTARAGFNFIAYNGVLYVIGGTNGTALNDVQFSNTGSDGSVPAWSYTNDISRGIVSRPAAAANGYMYFFGNQSSDTDVTYASINANGTLGPLHTSVDGPVSNHAHGSVLFYQGNFTVIGGCTVSGSVCTTPSTSMERVGQQAISRTGHYSKLFDTQVDTAPTQLVINGAQASPQSLVEFRFQSASQSDPVLGVAQLFRPVEFGAFYPVHPYNSSGVDVGVAFNYFYVITFDDSRSGTFPDVPKTGYSQTAVTDITLHYHANPSRRLRHGASFTDSGCNDVPANGCILDTAP